MKWGDREHQTREHEEFGRHDCFDEFPGRQNRNSLVTGLTAESSPILRNTLVEKLHPLLEHPDLLDTLNRAAEAHWNHDPGAKPVRFSMDRVVESLDGKWLVREFERSLTA